MMPAYVSGGNTGNSSRAVPQGKPSYCPPGHSRCVRCNSIMRESDGLLCARCNGVVSQDERVARARPLVTYQHFNRPDMDVQISCNQEHPIRLG